MQEIHIPTADEEAAAMLNAAAGCLREAQAKLSFGGDALVRARKWRSCEMNLKSGPGP